MFLGKTKKNPPHMLVLRIFAFKYAKADLAYLVNTQSLLQAMHLDFTFGGLQVGDSGQKSDAKLSLYKPRPSVIKHCHGARFLLLKNMITLTTR